MSHAHTATFVDRSLAVVRSAFAGGRKKRLAERAGLRESALRRAERPDWNPTVSTLRALEQAAMAEVTGVEPRKDAA